MPSIDGRSWVTARREGRSGVAQELVLRIQLREAIPLHAERPRRPHRRWKYIRYPHGDGSADRHLAELYDLKQDPDEAHQPHSETGLRATLQRLQMSSTS